MKPSNYLLAAILLSLCVCCFSIQSCKTVVIPTEDPIIVVADEVVPPAGNYNEDPTTNNDNELTIEEIEIPESSYPGEFRAGTSIVEGIKYNTYTNIRFSYSIDYPAILKAGAAPENQDGRVFRNDNAELYVWGTFLIFDQEGLELNSIKDYYNACLKGNRNITYKNLANDHFVLSGYEEDGRIFYEKTMYNETSRVYVTAVLKYNTSEKEYYNKAIKHIFKSLKPI